MTTSDSTYDKAARLWPALVLCAKIRKTLTYEDVAYLIGGIAQGVGTILGPIQSFCEQKKLHPLTSLVVHKEDGVPGDGYLAPADAPGAQAKVYAYDWQHHHPTAAELKAVESDA